MAKFDFDMATPYSQLKEHPQSADTDLDEELEQGRKRLSFEEDRWFHHIHTLLLVVSVFFTLAYIFVLMWHLLMPNAWRWLTMEEYLRMKDLGVSIIVGLSMSGITSYYFKRNGK